MTAELIIGSGAVALYGVAAVLAVANVVRTETPRPAWVRALPVSAALGALCLGVGLVVHGLRIARFPAFGAFEAASWYALAVTVSYLYVSQRHDVRALAAFLFPYQALLVLLGLFRIAATATTTTPAAAAPASSRLRRWPLRRARASATCLISPSSREMTPIRTGAGLGATGAEGAVSTGFRDTGASNAPTDGWERVPLRDL